MSRFHHRNFAFVTRSLALVALVFGLVAMALAFTKPASANIGTDPESYPGLSFRLQGCDLPTGTTLPIGGKFICPDSAYTDGNLGKNWNELDLVPHRVLIDAGNNSGPVTYHFQVEGDNEVFGSPNKIGYDFISTQPEQVLGPCTVSFGALLTRGTGTNNDPIIMYRDVTVTQSPKSTCQIDYYMRLALGAHLFPGSSLHSRLANNIGTSSNIGNKENSIPVKEIAPQTINKDMTATQGTDHIWDITKSATPATLSFANTCDTDAAKSAGVSITVSWQKLPATPSGPITIITHVYATNPAGRVITVNVSDDIRSGTTVLDTASSGPVDVPANTANFLILTHQTTVPDGTTNLNDVATATYTDKATGVPVPGNTTATASTTVQLSGPEKNQTATINDIESITGSGLSYSVDSFSGAPGGFEGGYVPGTPTTASVSWTSASQSGDGSVTFSKTVYVGVGTSTSGTLSDVATLTGSDGFSKQTTAKVDINADARVSLTINKSVTPALTLGSQTFTFHVKDSTNGEVATPTITFGVGDSSKSVTVGNLAAGTYTVSEDPVTGWDTEGTKTVTITLPSCSGSVSFTNTQQGRIIVKKVTDPAGSTQSFSFNASYNANGFSLKDGESNDSGFLSAGTYSVSENAISGWDLTGATCDDGSEPSSIGLQAGETVTCTFKNTQRGHIIVVKKTDPSGSSQSFTFTPSYNGGTTFALTDGQSNDSGALVPGSYSVAETVPSGWDQTGASCDNGNDPSAITLGAGQTVTCTFTNTQRGHIIVVKKTDPSGSSQSFTFMPNYNGGTTFGLTDGQSNDSGALKPGSYSVAETAVADWDQTGASCDNGNDPSAITLGAGQTVTCTFTNTQRGHIIVKKVTDPSGSSQSFTFTPNYNGGTTFGLTDGQSNDSGALVPGNYSVSEGTVSGWDLTSATCDNGNSPSAITLGAGKTVTCTFTNTQRGMAKVVKTVSGAAPSGTQAFTFQLRQGATTTDNGTTLETLVPNSTNGGTINFTTKLVPNATYQLCEIVMPGWLTSLGTFVPNSFMPPDGIAPNPTVDNSILCGNFTVQPGETKVFTIDNTPPPGGRALTIGFWKNWASCTTSSTNKKPVLDQTMAKAEPTGIVVSAQGPGTYPAFGGTLYLVLHGSTATPDKALDCSKAVNLLNKSTTDTGKKMASDPAFNLAAQLLAAELNYTAGAGKTPAATTAINQAVLLLGKYQFNGKGYTGKISAADATTMNNLAKILDDYNNDRP